MGWGNGNLGGGSGGLNFKVVGGTTAPSNPKDNTIWVNTNVPITGWTFSATEPEAPADGEKGWVWISTDTSSSVEFNALKKNCIQIYPVSAKQYANGAWVDVEAKSYQDGAWVDWWDGTIIDGYNQYTEIVGEWVEVLGSTGKVTWGSDGVTVTYTGNSGRHASIYSKNPIDITGFKTLVATVTKAVGSTTGKLIGVRKEPTTSTSINEYAAGYAAYSTVAANNNEQTILVDISELSGKHYVQIGCGVATLTIKRLQFIS